MVAFACLCAGVSPVHAALSSATVFNGNGNWSIDACGSNNTPTCDLSAVVPTGSTIESAFLYSSLFNISGPVAVPTVNFDGTTYSGGDWTALGSYNPDPSFPSFTLGAYRTDVTAQVAAAIGGGSATPYTFTIESEVPNGNIDGEVLAIIYSNPAEEERTIAFLDGFSTSLGDTTNINLADPLTTDQLADPGFEALLSLGIGFSAGPFNAQSSNVDVNGMSLTTCAGGFDDGGLFNGGLITAGGLGDDPSNPDCGVEDDDELYTLTPFLSEGDSQIVVETENPSLDDNIFFAGLNITAVAGINEPPPDDDDDDMNAVPEANTVALLGLGLVGIGFAARRRKLS